MVSSWGCLVNIEQVEGKGRATVKHAGRLIVEVGEQLCQRCGNFGRVWALQVNFHAIRADGADDTGQLEKAAKNAKGILGILVKPVKMQSQHSLRVSSGQ